MRNINSNDIVVVGHWDNEPIWRLKTPEEKLEEQTGINPDEAMVYLALLANKDNNNICHKN